MQIKCENGKKNTHTHIQVHADTHIPSHSLMTAVRVASGGAEVSPPTPP